MGQPYLNKHIANIFIAALYAAQVAGIFVLGGANQCEGALIEPVKQGLAGGFAFLLFGGAAGGVELGGVYACNADAAAFIADGVAINNTGGARSFWAEGKAGNYRFFHWRLRREIGGDGGERVAQHQHCYADNQGKGEIALHQ